MLVFMKRVGHLMPNKNFRST